MSLASDTARWKGVNLFSRAALIRSELVKMSHQGWDKFKAIDYQPLEAELREIEARMPARRRLRGAP